MSKCKLCYALCIWVGINAHKYCQIDKSNRLREVCHPKGIMNISNRYSKGFDSIMQRLWAVYAYKIIYYNLLLEISRAFKLLVAAGVSDGKYGLVVMRNSAENVWKLFASILKRCESKPWECLWYANVPNGWWISIFEKYLLVLYFAAYTHIFSFTCPK